MIKSLNSRCVTNSRSVNTRRVRCSQTFSQANTHVGDILCQERLAAEEQRWLQEKESDILTPYLIWLDHTETLSIKDAKQLRHDCLAEFKQRLVEHADLIQERYEKVRHLFAHSPVLLQM